ncbi:hypothetical protein HMPREF9628_00037 [Peptoanaerobacter stomatis]|uniref:ComF family protein n=1 Tax=Peptoanaerobacter stomatis TaxID=796937 RepID=G9X9U6_9FIRM|nr:ComF family protein [Peptoanaerobacter stomatis]EHL20192.1 hypothetical protein HMPREF9628_00037 [Peptoanaerobacter stomatis]
MELIFPKNIYCINCDKPISRQNTLSLCNNCHENIKFLYDKNVSYDKEVIELLKSKYIDDIKIATIYDEVMKNLIHKIKYSQKTYLARYFASILYTLICKNNIDFDFISSVPIHKKRLMQRGYNQVDLIVKYLSKFTKKTQISVSKRIKETKDMYALHLKERNEEMKDAFESEYDEKLSDKTLLIVDDILTTGATALNLCKSIKNKNKTVRIKIIFLSRASLK